LSRSPLEHAGAPFCGVLPPFRNKFLSGKSFSGEKSRIKAHTGDAVFEKFNRGTKLLFVKNLIWQHMSSIGFPNLVRVSL
jgi:hypothetical protein